MALRGIQEYIVHDVNNIARVEQYLIPSSSTWAILLAYRAEDEGNIVSIEGNIFLYPPKKSHQIFLILFI